MTDARLPTEEGSRVIYLRVRGGKAFPNYLPFDFAAFYAFLIFILISGVND